MVRVLPQVSKLGESALDLFFPRYCVGCGKEGSFICDSCFHLQPFIMPSVCPLCGRSQPSGVLCSDCVSWKAEIDGIRSPFRFEGVIQQAIYQLKYRNLRAIVPMLAGLMNDYLKVSPINGDVFVPVPLHKSRIRERGYNQSALLAKELSKLSGLPVVTDSLIKRSKTPPQAKSASVDERKKNVAGVFSVRDDRLRGKKVILIDDVSTSGATLDACAGVLKEAGTVSVWGFTLAREV
jgi:competence protein ComFC